MPIWKRSIPLLDWSDIVQEVNLAGQDTRFVSIRIECITDWFEVTTEVNSDEAPPTYWPYAEPWEGHEQFPWTDVSIPPDYPYGETVSINFVGHYVDDRPPELGFMLDGKQYYASQQDSWEIDERGLRIGLKEPADESSG